MRSRLSVQARDALLGHAGVELLAQRDVLRDQRAVLVVTPTEAGLAPRGGDALLVAQALVLASLVGVALGVIPAPDQSAEAEHRATLVDVQIGLERVCRDAPELAGAV